MYKSSIETALNPYKETKLYGRYITNVMIEPLLKNLPDHAQVLVEGMSVKKQPIYSITLGTGKKRILLWSQMHGNESTTTKALFDVLNTFKGQPEILESCTLLIIPILNPDGAEAYTRFNADNIDLNRDAQALSQPESVILHTCFTRFKPDFCFNLHGQRTIYNVGNTSNSATVSFLSPAEDPNRCITKTRKIAMEVIAEINNNLQRFIPNQVALYDDGFNHNCVGDAFQSLGVPTILFEAGHYPNDYSREVTRALIYQSLMVALHTISEKALTGSGFEAYLKIPQNNTCFFDIIIRNAIQDDQLVDIGIQYQEKLVANKLHFVPKIEKIEKLQGFYGHKELNASFGKVLSNNHDNIQIGSENDFVWINNEKYSLLLAES